MDTNEVQRRRPTWAEFVGVLVAVLGLSLPALGFAIRVWSLALAGVADGGAIAGGEQVPTLAFIGFKPLASGVVMATLLVGVLMLLNFVDKGNEERKSRTIRLGRFTRRLIVALSGALLLYVILTGDSFPNELITLVTSISLGVWIASVTGEGGKPPLLPVAGVAAGVLFAVSAVTGSLHPPPVHAAYYKFSPGSSHADGWYGEIGIRSSTRVVWQCSSSTVIAVPEADIEVIEFRRIVVPEGAKEEREPSLLDVLSQGADLRFGFWVYCPA